MTGNIAIKQNLKYMRLLVTFCLHYWESHGPINFFEHFVLYGATRKIGINLYLNIELTANIWCKHCVLPKVILYWSYFFWLVWSNSITALMGWTRFVLIGHKNLLIWFILYILFICVLYLKIKTRQTTKPQLISNWVFSCVHLKYKNQAKKYKILIIKQ